MIGGDLANTINAFCMKVVGCGVEFFETVEECVTYYSFLGGGDYVVCHDEAISYFGCYAQQEGCDDFSACYAYWDAFWYDCIGEERP